MQANVDLQTKKGDCMTRLHMHVVVGSLPEAIRFYSNLVVTRPCRGGKKYANWRIDEPPLNLAASVANRPMGLAHFGLEVGSGEELHAIDRVLRGPLREAGACPGKCLSEINTSKKEYDL
jgi:hypothetical protein